MKRQLPALLLLAAAIVEKLRPSAVVILTSIIVPSFMTSLPDTARRNIGNFGWAAVKRSHDDFNWNNLAGFIFYLLK